MLLRVSYLSVAYAFIELCKLSRTSAFVRTPHFPSSSCLPKHEYCQLFGADERKNLSASKQERREEEKRRRERQADVVIGKTSAVPEAKDYAVDPKATEEAWMRQASDVKQEVFRQTDVGMEMLKLLRLEEATEAFDRVFQLRPNAYLWQAGIAKFYQDDLQGAAEIFARNAATYESRFGEPATEERIWRNACQLKFLSKMTKKERKQVTQSGIISELMAQVPEREEMGLEIPNESRKVIRITKDLFSATVNQDAVAEVLARAKLRAICGRPTDQPQIDRKMWKLNAWFYLGLHYDVLGDFEESKHCMRMALRLCPSSGNGNDIIHTLPMLHMARRDWFDDDAFEEDSSAGMQYHKSTISRSPASESPASDVRGTSIKTDPVVVESIRTSVSNMRLSQIQYALKTRGLKHHGSKEALIEKLYESLLQDSGLVD